MGKATMVNELCDDALDFSKRHYRDKLNPPIPIAAIRARFADQQAGSVRPAEITSWLESLGVEPGTEARYKSTLSLCYREGIKNQTVMSNPARLVSNPKVEGGVLHYLFPAEEDRLRKAIVSRFPHHLSELAIALNTRMRRGEPYGLTRVDVDMPSRTITRTLPRTERHGRST